MSELTFSLVILITRFSFLTTSSATASPLTPSLQGYQPPTLLNIFFLYFTTVHTLSVLYSSAVHQCTITITYLLLPTYDATTAPPSPPVLLPTTLLTYQLTLSKTRFPLLLNPSLCPSLLVLTSLHDEVVSVPDCDSVGLGLHPGLDCRSAAHSAVHPLFQDDP